jgi:DNA-binding NtrC family response regulator
MPGEQRVTAIVFVSRAQPDASLASELACRGISLTWASSVRAAAEALQSSRAGIILFTEVALADGNWRDLLERVELLGKPIPVILVSSTHTAELWWDALSCGVADIVLPPILVDRLAEILGFNSTGLGEVT